VRAIILAAGFGTRLYPLTRDRPKPLLDLAGRPVIDHILERVFEARSIEDPVVVVTNARFEDDFRRWRSGHDRKWREGIRIVANDVTDADERRGALVDLRLALGDLHDLHPTDPDGFVVIAGDNVFGFPLDELVARMRGPEGDDPPPGGTEPARARASEPSARVGAESPPRPDRPGAVVVVGSPEPVDDLRGKGVACVDVDGRVVRVQEKPDRPECDRRIAAIYAFAPELPAWIDRFLEDGGNPDSPGYFMEWLVDTAPGGVRVAAYPVSGYRFDVGTPERLEKAREFFANRGEEESKS